MKPTPNFSKIFDEYGAFFAFGSEQFEKAKQEGVKYTSLPNGLVVPIEHAETVASEIKAEIERVIQLDQDTSSIQEIIMRELRSNEAFYTGEIKDTVDALKGYGIACEMIEAEYKRACREEVA